MCPRPAPQRVAQLAEHAILVGTDGFAQQLLLDAARSESRRELQAPGWGVGSQHGEGSLPMRAIQQGAEGVEPGQVGLARAVLLHAPPACGEEAWIATACAAEEGVGQRRLADPRLAGDEDHLAQTSAGPFQDLPEPLQLRFPADEGLGPAGSGRRSDFLEARRSRPCQAPQRQGQLRRGGIALVPVLGQKLLHQHVELAQAGRDGRRRAASGPALRYCA